MAGSVYDLTVEEARLWDRFAPPLCLEERRRVPATAEVEQPQGESQQRTAHLQRRLTSLGHNSKDDGYFGPKTDSNVREFQRRAGLTADGVVGPQTTDALRNGDQLDLNSPDRVLSIEDTAAASDDRIGNPDAEGELPDPKDFKPGAALHKGMGVGNEDGHEDVTALQDQLGIETDGRFGPETHKAVKGFQRRMGLNPDGIVGDRTQRALVGSKHSARQKEKAKAEADKAAPAAVEEHFVLRALDEMGLRDTAASRKRWAEYEKKHGRGKSGGAPPEPKAGTPEFEAAQKRTAARRKERYGSPPPKSPGTGPTKGPGELPRGKPAWEDLSKLDDEELDYEIGRSGEAVAGHETAKGSMIYSPSFHQDQKDQLARLQKEKASRAGKLKEAGMEDEFEGLIDGERWSAQDVADVAGELDLDLDGVDVSGIVEEAVATAGNAVSNFTFTGNGNLYSTVGGTTGTTSTLAEAGKPWIQSAIKQPGALRAQLGAKKGEKIPPGKLKAAAKSKGTLGKRARLAMTLKKLAKKKKVRKAVTEGLLPVDDHLVSRALEEIRRERIEEAKPKPWEKMEKKKKKDAETGEEEESEGKPWEKKAKKKAA